MFSIGQICNEIFHAFGVVMDDVTKHLDVCHCQAFDSIVSKLLLFDRGMIYISEYKQIAVRFNLQSNESDKRNLSVVLFRLNFGCKFRKMNFPKFSSQTYAQYKLKLSKRSEWLNHLIKMFIFGLKVELMQKSNDVNA